MHILYSGLVTDDHLSPEQQGFIRGLRGLAPLSITAEAPVAGGGTRQHKSFETAQNWVTAFFDKGAEEVLGYYADDFVWERSEEHRSELQSLLRSSYAVFCLKKKKKITRHTNNKKIKR